MSRNGKVITHHRTKPAAIDRGKLIAKRHGAGFVVHKRDGTLIRTQSYVVSPIA